ncbi:MAG TPA: 50S ribosomal protein L4 [Planctomycetota bacterium]|jgi:large subunit ribosomal protein L4|nr:50S ribosomal protein L4 [Planctomycetota bacterium]OQC19590.1 MAG: 50S ribosomal protein L4 [Planctomycetes bacterium ADurb.Bin069]NMD36621.1 50S ribosomal protein L4 [Planctomycetota bacterium]HNR99001.1 50S ribosomal protein L4 [Planctomycetota bacterium]HNU27000.1 50S ribosomal protein L4 [Planctomycetota bacterium]
MADLSLTVVNQSGEKVASIAVPRAALGTRVRPALIREAVVMYGANRRAGTASTKTRAEVNKSNRKPWAQKGTGRARAGSRRSPIWRGGGIIFGPKPRDYSFAINRKQKRLAVRSALLWKIVDNQVVVVDALALDAAKTKQMAAQLARLGITGSCLVGMEEVPRVVYLACRNIPGVKVVPVGEFNAYDVVRREKVLLTRGALKALLGVEEAKA